MDSYISIFIGALGCIPMLIAFLGRRSVQNLLKNGDLVTGTILEVYTHRGFRHSVYYRALIQYPVFNGAPIQGSYLFSEKRALKKYYKGRKLEICYDKNKPVKFLPKDVSRNNGLFIFTIAFAIGCLILCYFFYLETRITLE